MNEALLVTIGVAAVCVLVAFEVLKWVKAHQSNPTVQALEAKVPANVLSAAGIPVIDHPAIINAALQGAANVVAAANPPATNPPPTPQVLLGGSGAPAPGVVVGSDPTGAAQSMMLQALLGSSPARAPVTGDGVQSAPGDDPYKRPPYPSYWRYQGAQGQTVTSPAFTCPAGTYKVVLEVAMGTEVFVDGVKVGQTVDLTEGSHVATVKNDLQALAGTLQFVKA